MMKFKCMAQFVKRLLENPTTKSFLTAYWSKAFPQPEGRYDTGLSTELRFPVNMGQNGNEQVNPGNRQDTECLPWGLSGESLQDQCGMILLAACIIGKPNIF